MMGGQAWLTLSRTADGDRPPASFEYSLFQFAMVEALARSRAAASPQANSGFGLDGSRW